MMTYKGATNESDMLHASSLYVPSYQLADMAPNRNVTNLKSYKEKRAAHSSLYASAASSSV